MPGAGLSLIVILPLTVAVGSLTGVVCACASTATAKMTSEPAIAWRVEDTIIGSLAFHEER
jgi:hypothetical protein